MTQEVFKPVKGYEGLYEVSNLGRVKRLKGVTKHRYGGPRIIKEKFITIYLQGYNGKPYPTVRLQKGGVKKHKRVHRLVLEAFVPNLKNKSDVNHIDGDKTNNNLLNLEWNTRSENILHAFKLGLKKPNYYMLGKKGKDCPNSKKIYQYTKDKKLVKKWDSIMDIQRELNFLNGNISRAALGKRLYSYGYIWSYVKLNN